MNNVAADILVIGGGPAGMAAALAASESGRSATVVDDNPRLGGQIWRAELGRTKNPYAADLLRALERGSVQVVNNAQVFDGDPRDRTLIAEHSQGRVEFKYQKLIIATGARERFLPFPGWTLPNVFGVGGLQALVKGGLDVRKKRILVAGTGPLLLAAAEYLRAKGAMVLAVAEQTTTGRIGRFGVALRSQPSKLLQAAVLRAKLIGVPYLTDCWITSARGNSSVETVELRRRRRTWSLRCDMVACAFNLVPNIELASLLGCRIDEGFVAVDAFQQTSCEDVFCAGEPTGIAGLESSLIEGRIAGLAAASDGENARALAPERDRHRKFGRLLERTFELRQELRQLAANDTLLCRCEDVSVRRLTEFDNWRSAKLQTRCGMGPCQGRVCGTAAEFLFGWSPGPPRPPIFPVKMENL